jgi:hypothetical protein
VTNTLTHIDKDKHPSGSGFLKLRILCGMCRFKCCNSPSLGVETTAEESERLGLPRQFQEKGSCHCLTDTGCEHGEGRPVYCKLFPLQISPNNKVVVSHWALLNCPQPKHYKLIKVDELGYHYEPNGTGSGAIQKNIPDKVVSKVPLEERPTVKEDGLPALKEIFGDDFNFNEQPELNLDI